MSTKLAGLAAVTALIVGCETDRPEPTEFEVSAPVFVAGGNADFNLGTHLRGEEEVFTPAIPGGPSPTRSPSGSAPTAPPSTSD